MGLGLFKKVLGSIDTNVKMSGNVSVGGNVGVGLDDKTCNFLNGIADRFVATAGQGMSVIKDTVHEFLGALNNLPGNIIKELTDKKTLAAWGDFLKDLMKAGGEEGKKVCKELIELGLDKTFSNVQKLIEHSIPIAIEAGVKVSEEALKRVIECAMDKTLDVGEQLIRKGCQEANLAMEDLYDKVSRKFILNVIEVKDNVLASWINWIFFKKTPNITEQIFTELRQLINTKLLDKDELKENKDEKLQIKFAEKELKYIENIVDSVINKLNLGKYFLSLEEERKYQQKQIAEYIATHIHTVLQVCFDFHRIGEPLNKIKYVNLVDAPIGKPIYIRMVPDRVALGLETKDVFLSNILARGIRGVIYKIPEELIHKNISSSPKPKIISTATDNDIIKLRFGLMLYQLRENRLKNLVLNCKQLNNKQDIWNLLGALRLNKSLKSLRLSNIVFTDSQLKSLAEAIKQHPTLDVLKLDRELLDNHKVILIGAIGKKFNTNTIVDCDIQKLNFKDIIEQLADNPKAEEMILTGQKQIVKLNNLYSKGEHGEAIMGVFPLSNKHVAIVTALRDNKCVRLFNLLTGNCTLTENYVCCIKDYKLKDNQLIIHGNDARGDFADFFDKKGLVKSITFNRMNYLSITWPFQIKQVQIQTNLANNKCFDVFTEPSSEQQILIAGASASEKLIEIWNTQTGKCVTSINSNLHVKKLIWLDNLGKRLAAWGNNCKNLDDINIEIWDTENKNLISTLNNGYYWDMLLTSPDELVTINHTQTIQVWNTKNGTHKDLVEHTDVNFLKKISDGRFISADVKGAIKLWVRHNNEYKCELTMDTGISSNQWYSGFVNIEQLPNDFWVCTSFQSIQLWSGPTSCQMLDISFRFLLEKASLTQKLGEVSLTLNQQQLSEEDKAYHLSKCATAMALLLQVSVDSDLAYIIDTTKGILTWKSSNASLLSNIYSLLDKLKQTEAARLNEQVEENHLTFFRRLSPLNNSQVFFTSQQPQESANDKPKQSSANNNATPKTIQRHGFKFEITPSDGDGNCFYRSIEAQVLQWSHQQLRKATASYLERYSYYYVNLINGGRSAWKAYLADVQKNGHWADHLEIHALSEMLGRPIVIISTDANRATVMVNQNASGMPIFLLHDFDRHFDALFPVGNSRKILADILKQQKQTKENDSTPQTAPH